MLDWKLGCFFGSVAFFGGAEIKYCLLCMVSVKFVELKPTCACEKGGVVMLIFLSSGLDSTKWCEREVTKRCIQTQRGSVPAHMPVNLKWISVPYGRLWLSYTFAPDNFFSQFQPCTQRLRSPWPAFGKWATGERSGLKSKNSLLPVEFA